MRCPLYLQCPFDFVPCTQMGDSYESRFSQEVPRSLGSSQSALTVPGEEDPGVSVGAPGELRYWGKPPPWNCPHSTKEQRRGENKGLGDSQCVWDLGFISAPTLDTNTMLNTDHVLRQPRMKWSKLIQGVWLLVQSWEGLPPARWES